MSFLGPIFGVVKNLLGFKKGGVVPRGNRTLNGVGAATRKRRAPRKTAAPKRRVGKKRK